MNTNSKIRIALSAFVFLVGTAGHSSTKEQLPKKFQLQALFGKKTLTSFQGSDGYHVVDFWASWCQSCKTNLEKLEPLQKTLATSPSGSKIIAVSVDESREDAKTFFDSDGPGAGLKSIRKNVWLDQNKNLSRQLAFEGLPFLIVVDPRGNIVMRHSGALGANDIKKIKAIVLKP